MTEGTEMTRSTPAGPDGVFAYTWDIVGDPAAAERLAGLGVGSVTLQASYHAVRAITPRHPHHRVVHATHAAAYFPLSTDIWQGQRLRPPAPSWGVEVPDRFGAAATALAGAELRTEAWLVLTHSSALGGRAPEVTVRNAYGERYAYALCPAHPDVAAYAVNLAREICTRYDDVRALMLEACGWLGFEHGSHHEKTHGADLSPGCRALLSVCLCAACRVALADGGTGVDGASGGLDPDELARDIRTAVDGELREGRTVAPSLAETLGEDRAQRLFDHRRSVITGLARRIAAVAGGRELLLMAEDSPQSTGPDSALDLARYDGPADAYVLKCWDEPDAALTRVKNAAQNTAVPIVANVSVIDDPPGELASRVAGLRAAGARDIRFYHAGLASSARLDALRSAVRGTQR
ncbi:hypothetical protein ACFUN8_05165 [Streptomyces sp. NPDC057307]|uniref:hypothetical protein n=1 Tax=Streptomyces sp. NPDC057307 TaxID=3346096 RepID=UPI00363C08FD